jgi:hypothetical protein
MIKMKSRSRKYLALKMFERRFKKAFREPVANSKYQLERVA